MQVAEALQEAGAAAVCIHGRTMEQRYKKAADWGLVQQAATSLTVPIIGNGDVLTYYEVGLPVLLNMHCPTEPDTTTSVFHIVLRSQQQCDHSEVVAAWMGSLLLSSAGNRRSTCCKAYNCCHVSLQRIRWSLWASMQMHVFQSNFL